MIRELAALVLGGIMIAIVATIVLSAFLIVFADYAIPR